MFLLLTTLGGVLFFVNMPFFSIFERYKSLIADMKVKIRQAAKMFFRNSSLEMVYDEAVANAFDAGANNIEINITASSYAAARSLKIEIKDNGIGFTDERFEKFSHLFDVDDAAHKGLGRLVYVCYFDSIRVESYYGGRWYRKFEFSDSFDSNSAVSSAIDTPSGSSFVMSKCSLQKIKPYDYIKPSYLKKHLLETFFSKLYLMKQAGEKVAITITANIGGVESKETIAVADIPDLTMVDLDDSISLVDKMHMGYYINECDPKDRSLITAIAVDERTRKIEIIADEYVPANYQMIFLLYSDAFTGKIDAARQMLTFTEAEVRKVKKLFRDKIASILKLKVPVVMQEADKAKDALGNQYPHLLGYFDDTSIGFSSRNEVLQTAQEKFFHAQREILDATSLTEEQFKESLNLSARALTEYILFRQLTVNKLKSIRKNDLEAKIHNIIVPMKHRFDKDNNSLDLYQNNAWILDDKYMTYDTILSDLEMTELLKVITEDDGFQKDDDRPDIAIVFSKNPQTSLKFEIIIIELKKKGLSPEDNSKVEVQLEKRVRKLYKYYDGKIQRVWLYGIVEFTEEYESHLETIGYVPLYSSGKVYYNGNAVVVQKYPDKIAVPAGRYILDIDAVIEDANARNSTFLNLIKSKFKN